MGVINERERERKWCEHSALKWDLGGTNVQTACAPVGALGHIPLQAILIEKKWHVQKL